MLQIHGACSNDSRGIITGVQEAMDMVLTQAVEVLGNNRSQRYMCVIEDGVVVAFKHDATGVENTSAESALKELQKLGVKKANL